METPKLSVEAIEKGTVIDHIPAGKGLIILRQFKLLHYGSAVTVGFNLPSKTQGSKDIIKITGVWLDDNAANRLALFAPEAVVNTIDHFKVINKRRLTLPDEIAALETEQAEINAQLSDPEIFKDYEKAGALQNRAEEIETLLLEKLERWELLEAKQNGEAV